MPGKGVPLSGRIEHPRCHDDDDAGRHFDVSDVTTGAALDMLAPHTAPIKRMPPIEDFNLLPDMGRMTT